ncbi:MAG: hypothetical protein MUE40_14910 [Anaerolineae bacterium]|jgi:hypothetical protein|nr:hypothetical protein [Anaerolineae bacterium]
MTDDSSFQQNYMEGMSQFSAARSRAFFEELLNLLRGKSAELLSFEDVRARLRLREESYKGLQDIEIAKIRGSVGRYKNFTSTFLPKGNEMRERWSRVYAKINSMEGVPPIEVYKVGDVYFVRDGNHRVSIARQMGASHIQAHVTELPTSIEITPETTLHDLDEAAAYAAFLDETGLRQTRPHHQAIDLSEPSRYPELLGHIYLHAQVMEHLRGEPVPLNDAAANWYDNVFRPAITLIRKHEVLRRSGDERRTEADLYLWMVDHLREIRQQFGGEARARKFSDALVDYLAQRKIPIPRDLLAEDDDSVILSRTQIMRAVDAKRAQPPASTAAGDDDDDDDDGD